MPNTPWDDAVAKDFADDPATAARVSQFMATHYQPYVTKLENERAASKEAEEFLQAFTEDAGGAFLHLAGELFGEEGADAIVAALTDEGTTPPPNEGEPVVEPQKPALDPEDAEVIAWAKEARAKAAADAQQAEYEQLKTKFLEGKDDIKAKLFDPFVASNDGDWEKAEAAYREFHKEFVPVTEATTEAAPGTIPSSGTTPPTQKEYHTFDEAWNDFEAEQRALQVAPPTV